MKLFEKSFIAAAVCALALLSGCGKSAPKGVSESDAQELISKNFQEAIKEMELPLAIKGKPTLTQESKNALEEVRIKMSAEGFTGTLTEPLEASFTVETTKHGYDEVRFSEVYKNDDTFERAKALARRLNLKDIEIPDVPKIYKLAAEPGSSFKVGYEVHATFRIDRDKNAITVASVRPTDADFDELPGGTYDDGKTIVLIDTPQAEAVFKECDAFILEVEKALKARQAEQEAQEQKAKEEREAQEKRAKQMEEAVAKAAAAFDGRYTVELRHEKEDAPVKLGFYFYTDEKGNKVGKFETTIDSVQLERSFRVGVRERDARNEFLPDGVARAIVDARAQAVTSNRGMRGLPQIFSMSNSTCRLVMSSDSTKPGELTISGSGFSGVATKAE